MLKLILRYNKIMYQRKTKQNTDTAWRKQSSQYKRSIDRDDSYQKSLILPGLIDIIKPSGRELVLDIGCGTGFFSHALARSVKKVVGIDPAPDMIAAAAKQRSANVSFLVGDAMKLPPLKEKYNLALMVMMIQNVSDMGAAFSEAARNLLPGSQLIIVMNHPVFRIPRQSAWGWDEERKLQYRRIDSYMTENKIPIEMRPGTNKKIVTWSFHRPFSAYAQALRQAGFSIDDVQEWVSPKSSDPGARAKAEDRARKEFPLFLTIVARKLS